MKKSMHFWSVVVITVLLLFAGLGASSAPDSRFVISRQTDDGDFYGYIDSNGKEVIPPKFRAAHDFRDGAAIVIGKEKNESGTIASDGNYLNHYVFDLNDRDYREGLAAVKDPNRGKWGFIDKKGKKAIEMSFTAVGDFSDGLAKAIDAQTELLGYIDKTGKWIIKPQFKDGADFSEGFAQVAMEREYGFIGRDGKFLAKYPIGEHGEEGTADLLSLTRPFSEGLAAVQVQVGNHFDWGCIDKNGKIVIRPSFNVSPQFRGGLAVLGKKVIDRTGKIILGEDWARSNKVAAIWTNFNDGIAIASIDDGSFIVIDTVGKTQANLKNVGSVMHGYREGLAKVVLTNSEEAYVDRAGRVVWQSKPHANGNSKGT